MVCVRLYYYIILIILFCYITYYISSCWFFLACRNNTLPTSMALAHITPEDRNMCNICLICLTDCIYFVSLRATSANFLQNTPSQEGQIGSRCWRWLIFPVTSKHFPLQFSRKPCVDQTNHPAAFEENPYCSITKIKENGYLWINSSVSGPCLSSGCCSIPVKLPC